MIIDLKVVKKPIVCIEFSRDVKNDYKPKFIYDLLKGKETQTPLIQE